MTSDGKKKHEEKANENSKGNDNDDANGSTPQGSADNCKINHDAQSETMVGAISIPGVWADGRITSCDDDLEASAPVGETSCRQIVSIPNAVLIEDDRVEFYVEDAQPVTKWYESTSHLCKLAFAIAVIIACSIVTTVYVSHLADSDNDNNNKKETTQKLYTKNWDGIMVEFLIATDRKDLVIDYFSQGYLKVCQWEIIGCTDTFPMDMDKIAFNGQGLAGTLPSSTIGELDKLTYLSLVSNAIGGSIPIDGLKLLSDLQYLDLSFNSFNGSIPSELGLLTNLEFINLSETNIEGVVPSELGLLSNLKNLSIVNTHISGSIPNELCKLMNEEALEGILIGEQGTDITCECCTSKA